VGVVLVFLVGRWTADPPPPAPAQQPVAEPAAPPRFEVEAPRAVRAAPVRPEQAPPVSAPPPERPAPPAAPVTPELAQRVKAETVAQLELLRPEIVALCWPSGGLSRGRTSATVTFNITFDAQGREIARGITEDRRAPAGEFARCLRELPGMGLTIAAPGTNVGVAIPVSYP
jgi:hypothetical protein